MRSRTGKYGRYWYYTCSRKADIGASACGGTTMAMGALDDLVTEAVCGHVLEPQRLAAMLKALAARGSTRREREGAQLRRLMAKRRALSAQVRNLLDVMEDGGLGAAKAVQQRFADRQQELDALDREIAHKRSQIERPVEEIAAARAERFAAALGERLRDQANPGFRRAYLRLMLDKVVVGPAEVRISGAERALAHLAADAARFRRGSARSTVAGGFGCGRKLSQNCGGSG